MAVTVPGPLPVALTQAGFDALRPGASLWPLLSFLGHALAQAPAALARYTCAAGAEGLWAATLNPWPAAPATGWYLQLTFAADAEGSRARAAAAAWPHMAKVAAPKEMPRLVRAALPGLRLRAVPHLPQRGAPPPHVRLFALEGDNDAWQAVREARALAILPPDNGRAQVTAEILCLQGEGA